MLAHRLHRHFLPHFFASSDFGEVLGDFNKIYHRAHALSLPALFVYVHVFLFLAVSLFVLRINTGSILGEITFSPVQIIELTNQRRAEMGLEALFENQLLDQAAQAKARDMFANDYWAHNSPQGKTPWSFITGSGYRYLYAGENLARDFTDSGEVVQAWMNSPSHRSNLLDTNFREIGVAVANGKIGGKEGILVVQMFGSTSDSRQLTPLRPERSRTGFAGQAVESPQSGYPSLGASSTPVVVLAQKQFTVAKGASLVIVGFIFLLFAIEVVLTLKRKHVGLKSGVLAHLAVLGFMLIVVWYTVAGSIL